MWAAASAADTNVTLPPPLASRLITLAFASNVGTRVANSSVMPVAAVRASAVIWMPFIIAKAFIIIAVCKGNSYVIDHTLKRGHCRSVKFGGLVGLRPLFEGGITTAGNALWVSPLSFLEASTPGTGGFIDTPNQRLFAMVSTSVW